jgi:hypothetical protein
MLLDAAETVLGIFGFDRTVYGEPRNKEWWQELRKIKKQDIEAEAFDAATPMVKFVVAN